MARCTSRLHRTHARRREEFRLVAIVCVHVEERACQLCSHPTQPRRQWCAFMGSEEALCVAPGLQCRQREPTATPSSCLSLNLTLEEPTNVATHSLLHPNHRRPLGDAKVANRYGEQHPSVTIRGFRIAQARTFCSRSLSDSILLMRGR